MPKNVYQDAHTLIDGLRKCVYLMESQDSLYEREVEYLRDEKSKLVAENDVLKIKLSQCEKETTRNRIEADLWKTILEDSLEKIVDKFYIEKPRYETGWWYVHILVSEDYHGEEPDLSSSPIHNTERVFPFWHHDESDFDDAVRYAKEGSIGLD